MATALGTPSHARLCMHAQQRPRAAVARSRCSSGGGSSSRGGGASLLLAPRHRGCSSSSSSPIRSRSMVVRASSSSSSSGRHAKLHDFCMTIPYGGLALLSGAVALAFKAQAIGLQLAGAGAVVSLCSLLSLRSWRAGRGSAPFTLLSAGTSGCIAYQMWQRVAASVAPVPSGILLALSAALAAFCLYNVAAGGNPPPSKPAAAAAP